MKMDVEYDPHERHDDCGGIDHPHRVVKNNSCELSELLDEIHNPGVDDTENVVVEDDHTKVVVGQAVVERYVVEGGGHGAVRVSHTEEEEDREVNKGGEGEVRKSFEEEEGEGHAVMEGMIRKDMDSSSCLLPNWEHNDASNHSMLLLLSFPYVLLASQHGQMVHFLSKLVLSYLELFHHQHHTKNHHRDLLLGIFRGGLTDGFLIQCHQ
mmetsp:Transcript_5519/g.7842  ORF Transcript_5519/g.7842 Transcript_5519/m.7842 type:complete len:210 (+) Transcript_5519:867-1496(+)